VHLRKETVNGVIMHKMPRDDSGFAVWYPIEFLHTSPHTYSQRWSITYGHHNNTVFDYKPLFSGKPSVKDIQKYWEGVTVMSLNMNYVTSDGDIGY
jgi:hypothetical protein